MKYNLYLKNKKTDPVIPFIFLIFTIIIVLTFSNFFRIGFTTSDDLICYMTTLKGNMLEYTKNEALRSGCVFFIFTQFFHFFSYIFDNFYLTKVIQHLSILLNFILTAVVINRIFKIKEFALIVLLLLLSFLTVTPNLHMPTIAYPLYFSFSISTFLISILFYIKKVNIPSMNLKDEASMYNAATSNESTIYYYSDHKSFIFNFFITGCNNNIIASVNDLYEIPINENYNSIRINNHNLKEEITSFNLKTSQPFLISSFIIANLGNYHEKQYNLNFKK